MRKPQRHKPRQKPTPQKHVTEIQPSSANVAENRRGWPSATAIISVVAAILGIGAALATFWPRITVEHSGTLATPASIVFSTTVNSYIPLRYPSVGIIVCDLVYGTKPPTIPPSSCPRPFGDNMPHSPPDPSKGWLDLDERVDSRLEDFIGVANTPIARANIIVTVGFYLWYFPRRFNRYFGFSSVQGSDGQLYLRQYAPDPY
jgi:hypothetical protein